MVILFDIGNVLVDITLTHFSRPLMEHTQLTEEEIHERLFQSGAKAKFDRGTITALEYYNALGPTACQAVPFDIFAVLWCSIFSPITANLKLVSTLHNQYPLFLLSNTDSLHFAFLRNHISELALFENYILSFKVGALKPEASIYAWTENLIGAVPGELIFIDDRPENVQAARQRGWNAIEYSSPGRLVAALEDLGVYVPE